MTPLLLYMTQKDLNFKLKNQSNNKIFFSFLCLLIFHSAAVFDPSSKVWQLVQYQACDWGLFILNVSRISDVLNTPGSSSCSFKPFYLRGKL